MATLFVRHTVQDYATWRRVYDGTKPLQRSAGVLANAVYQSPEDPNMLTVSHDFASLDEARAWIASPDLHTAMERAGVVGTPDFWIANRA